MVHVGQVLIHPVHGRMVVTAIDPPGDEEYIDGKWRDGHIIHAKFDRFIPGIRWREGKGKNTVSKLIFHEYYLDRLRAE